MRLERKREQELEKRKGATCKTIIQFIWLLISFVIAYFAVDLIISAGYVSYEMIYRGGLPRVIPPVVIKVVLMFVIVIAMQFFLFIGFMVVNPEGRRRTGNPTLKSGTKDPYDYGRD